MTTVDRIAFAVTVASTAGAVMYVLQLTLWFSSHAAAALTAAAVRALNRRDR